MNAVSHETFHLQLKARVTAPNEEMSERKALSSYTKTQIDKPCSRGQLDTTQQTDQILLPLFVLLSLRTVGVPLLQNQFLYNLHPHTHSHIR